MQKKKDYIDIVIYTVLAYGIGNLGFFLWFVLGYEAAAFITIIAPITAYFILRRIRKNVVKVSFKNISAKGILAGAGVPICYTAVSVIIYVCFRGKFLTDDFTVTKLMVLIVQWIFAGICEEVGWRGFLFPTLRKWNNGWSSYIICGLIWSGWHMPMIFSDTIMTSWSYAAGILMLCIEGIVMSIIIDKLMQITNMSIWTSIFVHAFHNIAIQLLLLLIPQDAYRLLDDGGLLSLPLLVITALILVISTKHRTTTYGDSVTIKNK